MQKTDGEFTVSVRSGETRRIARIWRVALGVAVVVACSVVPSAGDEGVVAIENARPGTADWRLTDPARNREIEGYASLPSVGRGETISFFVNTSDPTYRLEVFRLGWYDGLGGRRVADAVDRTGIRQFIPSPHPVTGYLECDWVDPYELTIPEDTGEPTDWASGVYVAKLTADPSGKQSYIVFVVRDDDRASEFLFQSAVISFQAANNWGGRSLMSANSIGQRASRVSFARPYGANVFANAAFGVGAGELMTNLRSDSNQPVAGWQLNMIRWIEREGYDVTYATAVDTHRDPTLLTSHAAVLFAGRDEYWTEEMYANVDAALDEGTGLGLFATGTGEIPVQLGPAERTGEPDRSISMWRQRRSPLRPATSRTTSARREPTRFS